MAAIDPADAIGQLKVIHSEFRTAALNQKYYRCMLDRYQRYNTWYEVLIALGATGATGAGIAGFAIWKSGAGALAWALISGLSIVLATLKPIIALPKTIERYSKLASSYSTIFEAYRGMELDIEAIGALTTEHVEQFKTLRGEVVKLAADDDGNPDRELIKRFEDQVKKEIPAPSLWMPKTLTHHPPPPPPAPVPPTGPPPEANPVLS